MDFNEFLTDLKSLIEIRSVKGESKENMPFGEGIYNVLHKFLEIADRMGFETINYDNYGGEVVFGEGEELGIIGHLDVVPEGTGWNTPPYTLTEKDGVFYGRGLCDDKSPLLICLYVLKELKDSGKKINRKFRLIVGCDEESGWQDIEYIKTKTTLPEYGFSPDGNFPVSYAEKGMIIAKFMLPKLKNFYDINGGTVVNAVCGKCSVKTNLDISDEKLKEFHLCREDGYIVANGKPAHGSCPERGINAIEMLYKFFDSCGENVKNVLDFMFINKANINELKSEQGETTFSADIIKETEKGIEVTCDIRFPYPITENDVRKVLDKFPYSYSASLKHGTQFVDKNSFLVNTLLESYKSVFNKDSKPISQGGSTFARAFKKGCAFGPEFEDEIPTIHEPNECIKKENLKKLYAVYFDAISNLAK